MVYELTKQGVRHKQADSPGVHCEIMVLSKVVARCCHWSDRDGEIGKMANNWNTRVARNRNRNHNRGIETAQWCEWKCDECWHLVISQDTGDESSDE